MSGRVAFLVKARLQPIANLHFTSLSPTRSVLQLQSNLAVNAFIEIELVANVCVVFGLRTIAITRRCSISERRRPRCACSKDENPFRILQGTAGVAHW
jgi:hypothetical protein